MSIIVQSHPTVYRLSLLDLARQSTDENTLLCYLYIVHLCDNARLVFKQTSFSDQNTNVCLDKKASF